MAAIQRKAEVTYHDEETKELLDASTTTYQAYVCDACGRWQQSREIPDNWYLLRCMRDFLRNEREEAHVCSRVCLLDYAKSVVEEGRRVAA